MDSTALYGIMVFLPIVIWIAKVSLSYRIQYDLLPRKHGKYYIKRNKKGLWNGYFCMCFRKSLSPLVFLLNFILGCWLFWSAFASIVYFVLWISNYHIHYEIIPVVQMRAIILTWYIHFILIIVDKIRSWISNY